MGITNKIICGDCIEELKKLDENSIDAIVTDLPYGLGFMGKEWDTFDKTQFGIAGEEGENDLKIKKNFQILPRIANGRELYDFCVLWASECLRVLKPGGYLLSFGGTRTFHRMACAIEDAGFQIRDMIQWLYATGFPKSLDVSKAIDKQPNKSLDFKLWLKNNIDKNSKSIKILIEECGFDFTHYYRTDIKSQESYPSKEKFDIMKRIIGLSDEFDFIIENFIEERGYKEVSIRPETSNSVIKLTGKSLNNNPISEKAKQWEGWGTALKPANEPICVARKPLSEKTVAENILKWGTGGINIDATRIPIADKENYDFNNNGMSRMKRPEGDKLGQFDGGWKINKTTRENNKGRFPANLILDELAAELLDEQSGESQSVSGVRRPNADRVGPFGWKETNRSEGFSDYTDSGGASRFFYVAKASKAERNKGLEEFEKKYKPYGNRAIAELKRGEVPQPTMGKSKNAPLQQNHHPTVKPVQLMQYLVKMVCVKGGTIADPFAGSGTTGIGAKLEGMNFIGIEKNEDYCRIAEARIQAWEAEREEPKQNREFF